jgi:hypothetical protein
VRAATPTCSNITDLYLTYFLYLNLNYGMYVMRTELRALLVSVDYSDLLSKTLPYNRHHFKEVMVVTSLRDLASAAIAEQNDAEVYCTNLFYKDGAKFNKWRALEKALDYFGRHGILCIMDADVLWPKVIMGGHEDFKHGQLYSPLRHMAPWPLDESGIQIPSEISWGRFPIHRNINEWAGYTQIFHASDPALGQPPWHDVTWSHAGGADSFFQRKWSKENKVRTLWNVLHLGEPGINWQGRVTPYGDGSLPRGSHEGREAMQRLWDERRRRDRYADEGHGEDRYDNEKLTPR